MERMQMRIVPYSPQYRKDFVEMNTAWITDMFSVEPGDLEEFSGIESSLASDGQIFFALSDDGTAMACCMIAPRNDGDWEIMKFAARDEYAGQGAGSACLQACLDYARGKSVRRIVIVSNRRCTHAVHLYRKLGFREIPVDKERFPFERADIAFEMDLRSQVPLPVVPAIPYARDDLRRDALQNGRIEQARGQRSEPGGRQQADVQSGHSRPPLQRT